MEWDKRADKHQDIANKIYGKLFALNETRYGVSFQVLVSLLQDTAPNDMLCMESESKGNRHIQSFNSHGVSYFIQYFNTSDLSAGLNATWEAITKNNADIVDAVFSSKTNDLCKAGKSEIEKAVDKKVFGLEGGFSGWGVVRCGSQFVWYELGHRYFTVGRTAGPSFPLVSANDGTYNSNCGQIFLFP
ncbi:hypothetical protein AAVH_15283 [Aphelenchoides avenae]|nr:hypothetical protein AAVH_15283 [Aphelenchus avenae]